MLDKLCDYIRSHGISSYVSNGKLHAMSEYTQHGELHCEWVVLPASYQRVREWLGY